MRVIRKRKNQQRRRTSADHNSFSLSIYLKSFLLPIQSFVE
jgi:hypothetical protein